MLKAVYVCVVAVGILLSVSADTGSQEEYGVNSEIESSETNLTSEVSTSTENSNELEAESNKTCGTVPKIEGTIIDIVSESNEYSVGTRINYQCSFGYVSRGVGLSFSDCKIDEQTGVAKWTNPDISCVSRSCGDPGYVANGRRIGNLFSFPNKIEFECEEGYKLRGLGTRFCQATGEWSGRLPICELVYCSVPPNPVNGRVRYLSLEYGTELQYECNKGFILRNHEPRFCMSNGTWSNNEPECIEAICEKPHSPIRGSVQLHGEPKVGSIVVYFCDEGTTMFGPSASKCLISGDWTFDPPKCLRSCQIPDVKDGEIGKYESIRISRSQVSQQFVKFQLEHNIKHSETVILRCKPGFQPLNFNTKDGIDEVTCNDGMWDKPLECQQMSCLAPPPSIENGDPVVSSTSHGSTIYYMCHRDFRRTKTGGVRCDHGEWKGHTPVCSDTRCYLDQLNFTSLLKPNTKIVKHMAFFNIHCKKGYKNTSPWKAFKCSFGKWNIDKNPCVIETCEDEPPPVMNGKPNPFDREHGSVVNYECDQNFDIIGNTTVRCEAGTWEGEPPSCQESIKRVETTPSEINTESMDEEDSTPQKLIQVNTCFCTFDYRTDLVSASVGNAKINAEDRVEKGQTVTLNCLYPHTFLLWPNGMRQYGPVNLTCDACVDWKIDELPTCEVLQPGDSALIFYENVKILPGGIIEIPEKRSVLVQCANHWLQPKWYPGDFRNGMHFTHDSMSTVQRTSSYSANMNIDSANRELAGRYECFAVQDRTAYRATAMDLKIVEPEIRCPELHSVTNKGIFHIRYENNRNIDSMAYYSCRDNTKKIIGRSSRKCLRNGKWSGTFPSCEDITCWKNSTYNGLVVSFTNDNKVDSIARFSCSEHGTLVGNNSSICQHNGTWSNPWPRCTVLDIRCPVIDGQGIFTISYTNDRRMNSTANFYCKSAYQKVEGCNFMTCQQNGEWSGTYPTCIDYPTCIKFEESDSLSVSYSDGVRVHSVASFQCLPSYAMLGSSFAVCRSNGTWNHPMPTCTPPRCSIESLMSSLPEGVVADLREVTEDSVAQGTDLELLCEDGLIHIGSSKATCELEAKWEYGNVQCVVGCRLSDVPSHLLIEPIKEYHRFGDFLLLKCPPGQKLTSDVERVMCLGKTWSDPLPGCIEVTETTSPASTKYTRKRA